MTLPKLIKQYADKLADKGFTNTEILEYCYLYIMTNIPALQLEEEGLYSGEDVVLAIKLSLLGKYY